MSASSESPDEADEASLSRRAKRSAEMTARLLDAAEALYAEEGAPGLTNRRIGERADTTTQSIYTYFGSRDALLEAMVRRAVDAVREIIELAPVAVAAQPEIAESDAGNEVVAAFKVAARAYRDFCLAHPGRFRIIRTAAVDLELEVSAIELRQMLVQAIADLGRSRGIEQAEEFEARIHMAVAAMHGFFDAEIDGFIDESCDPDRLFDELMHRCIVPYETILDS